jgi:hypothetical protein
MYDNPRQVVYFDMKELIKVASLSKRERETVLNSKIVKENRNEKGFKLTFGTYEFKKNTTDIALKGLLMAIRLNNTFALSMYTLDNDEENRFK